jgi:23S rRNA pseudouridine1911/1915/1917 synthase
MTVVRATVAGRLDRVLRQLFPDLGRRAVERVIAAKAVRVNGTQVRLSSWEVLVGDVLDVEVQALAAARRGASEGRERFAELTQVPDEWIRHTDEHVVAIAKPEGLRSEAVRADDTSPNLLTLVRARFDDVTLAHRLDRDTSGVLLFARSPEMRKFLDESFRAHTVVKRYVAVATAPNELEESGTIRFPLKRDPSRRDRMIVTRSGGDSAITDYRLLKTVATRSLVELSPRTGRTHQLRVHLAALGAPIVGDRLYGPTQRPGRGTARNTKGGDGAAASPRLLLHARDLELPDGGPTTARVFHATTPAELTLR